MSSNQFQNTRAFFYAIGMFDGPLRSYIINSTKFPACLYGLDYPDEDSIITSRLCREVDKIEWYINGVSCDDCFTDNAYCVMAFGNNGLTCKRCKSRGNSKGCLGDDCSIPEMDFLPVKSQRDYVKKMGQQHHFPSMMVTPRGQVGGILEEPFKEQHGIVATASINSNDIFSMG
ncbi:hypothetical protein BDQ17DRAFT_1333342 [Cyathus striatus]|nr:hypothetical protein BDQ17DRAFT_1333342 [Cyathus striatus]